LQIIIKEKIVSQKAPKTTKDTARRIFLDSSSPSISSIVRVVLVVIIGLVTVGLGVFSLYYLQNLFFLIILSVFFAYLLNPLVRLIRRPFKERHLDKFMPRSFAIVIAYLVVFLVFGLAVAYLAPRVIDQAKEFAGNLPGYSEQIKTRVTAINERYENYQLPPQVREELNNKITGVLGDLGGKVTEIAGSLAINILSISPFFILIPILSFFFLKDVNMFRVSILRMFPSGLWRSRAESFLEDVNTTLAAYTRAQLISCVLIGTVCTILFYILDVNYALLLGILAGIFEFVPLIGPAVIGIVAVTIAAFSSGTQAVSVGISLAVLRLVHDYVTYPRIVREGIHLHPLAIVLSVLAGEQIAGIPGVFLSIPFIALFTVIYKHVREHRGNKGIVADLLTIEKDEDVGETLAT
jgi:predicted PurR-regulated permease PerM